MLEQLLRIVPPPASPVNSGGEAEWRGVMAAIGMELPRELFLISSQYGSGHFTLGEFWVEVHSVFRPGYPALVEFNRRVFQQEAARNPGLYARMFELGGYGWGDEMATMGRLFWVMAGSADEWTVGITRPVSRYACSVTGFLTKCFAGEIRPDGFPSSFEGIAFEPWAQTALEAGLDN